MHVHFEPFHAFEQLADFLENCGRPLTRREMHEAAEMIRRGVNELRKKPIAATAEPAPVVRQLPDGGAEVVLDYRRMAS